MEQYQTVFKQIQLFQTMDTSQILSMLKCLNAHIETYQANETIVLANGLLTSIGIVLDGCAHIVQEDLDGNRNLISVLEPTELFGETILCAGIKQSPVDVIAITESTILFIDFNRILHTCSFACIHHSQLIENMLYILANKNLYLQKRMQILTQKNLRNRIYHFLKSMPQKNGYISIPFNREQMAQFLSVDRTSLSHELSRMKNDGILDYHKNQFKIQK